MRILFFSVVVLLLTTISLGQRPSVTTAPAESAINSTSDVEDLIARLHALQAENDLLRAQLSSVAQNAPAAQPTKPAVPEKPIAGMEALMQGFPKDQMPTAQDDRGGLRYSLLLKWVKEHSTGKSISLRGRFGDADAVMGDTFVIRIGTGQVPQWVRPFTATVVVPADQASKVLPLHPGDPIDITGHIQTADVLHVNGLWVVFFQLENGNIESSGKSR